MDKKMISVVVPCYNCEKTIKKCVDSIIGQTYDNLELILVDDGSSDDTLSILKEYEKKDRRVTVLFKENGGTLSARKEGIKCAKGEYVSFCDSDDWLSNDLYERINKILNDYNPDIVVFGSSVALPSGEKKVRNHRLSDGYYTREDIEKKILPNLYYTDGFNSKIMSYGTVDRVYRKGLIAKAIEEIKPGIRFNEDILANFVTLMNADDLYYANELYGYFIYKNESSKTGRYDPGIFDEIDRTYSEHLNLAKKYGYAYTEQIYIQKYYLYLNYIKRVIQRSTDSRKRTISIIRKVCETASFRDCEMYASKCRFGIKSGLFARLLSAGCYGLVYTIAGIRKV